MSEEATRARPYTSGMKEELVELNLKLDSLIKHWADAAEMTTIMEACRQTVHESHQANHEALMHVHRQLGLLLTPVERESPSRARLLYWSGVVLVGLLLSFWLGGVQGGGTREARRLRAFLGDVHLTLEENYGVLPYRLQQLLQTVYQTHKFEPLRQVPVEKK